MTEPQNCAACRGALDARGLCPRCLLRLGMERVPGLEDQPPHPEEALGSIGPYRLLSVLGEGGMGIVYLAEQTEPIRRRVALKIIKRGMDSREVIARFESERQALALMSHPNIAGVLDAGTTDSGLPFFVMEHVAGVPITGYCDENRLSAPERLRLFIEVCGAIQHAHQKGVIHRDVKPSNVLVTLDDGKPHPKVIDFGVAKATSQRLTEKTLFTERGILIGTPGYMSPEQAQMTDLDVDTRTDVYSLGVLLYELLVGALPFDPRRLREAGWAEMQRIIREEEPIRPSTKVSTMGDAASTIADQRHTDPAALRRELAGDLDWITLKALEKDRTRRYGTAAELAADIERHLQHEPVAASPPNPAYRLKKLVRRHRVLFLAAAAVFVALMAGLAGTITQARRAIRQTAIAESHRKRADLEARAASEQRDFALRQLSRAEAINDLNAFVLSDAAPSGKPFTAGELLARAKQIAERQPKEADENTVEVLIAIGRQYQGLDEDREARPVLEKAYALSRGLPDRAVRAKAACALAAEIVRTGEHERAEALIREGQGELPNEPRFALHRIFCLLRGSDVAQDAGDVTAGVERVMAARQLLKESRLPSALLDLQVTMALAESYRMAGRNREASAAFEQASARLTALGRGETERAGTLFNNWGVALNTLGQPLAAERLFRRAIAISSADKTERHVSPMLLNNLARTLRDLDRLPEAAAYAERAYAKARELGNENVVNQSLSLRCGIYRQMGQLGRAAEMIGELEPRLRRMVPAGHVFYASLASHRSLLFQARGDLEASIVEANRALGLAEASAQGSDYLPQFLRRRSDVERQMGRLEDARSDGARALWLEQEASEPGTFSSGLGLSALALGRALGAQGKRDEARAAFATALEHLEPSLGPDHPDTRAARELRGAGPSTPRR